MILKIPSDKYYGHQNKTKAIFKRKYQGCHLRWMEKVKLGEDIVDGWFSNDMKEYLLKLPEEGNLKRFTGNCTKMIDFLKSCGAIEFADNEKGCHIDYNDMKNFITQEDIFGHFVGADLFWSYRNRELMKNLPDDLGIVWSEKKPDVKKRRIVRRIKR